MDTQRTRMRAPTHPGEILREDVLPALKLTQQEAAAQLDVPVDDLVHVLNADAPVTAEFAARIEAWLGVDHGGDAEFWLAMQAQYDLWKARQHRVAAEVTPVSGTRPAVKKFRLDNHPIITPEEDAEINRGIASDPDTFEPTAEQIAKMKWRGRP